VNRLPAGIPPAHINAPVHYVSEGSPVLSDGSQRYPSTCRAADVTEVDPEDQTCVGLMVKNPTGTHFRPLGLGGAEYGYAHGQWHHLH
jgi:hypothetical protein